MYRPKVPLLNHFGLSGGKDSTRLMLWAIHESGYDPDSLLFTWCDTGNENALTELYVQWLAVRLGYRIKTIRPPMGFYDLARKKKRFPSARVRYCTQELKIFPTKQYVDRLIAKGFDIVLHTGVRAAESDDRALLPERAYDDYYDCEVYRPILRESLEDIWAAHDCYGIPPNPLYGLTETLPWNGTPNPFYQRGAMRVGCDPCVMSAKAELRHMAVNRPERIAFLRSQESSFRNRNHYSSMFARDKVPACQRSKEIITKDGRHMKVPTIDDVARWAQTSRGGVQYTLDLPMTTELTDETPSCASRYGYCE